MISHDTPSPAFRLVAPHEPNASTGVRLAWSRAEQAAVFGALCRRSTVLAIDRASQIVDAQSVAVMAVDETNETMAA